VTVVATTVDMAVHSTLIGRLDYPTVRPAGSCLPVVDRLRRPLSGIITTHI
jgi:hypothetical protein